MNIRILFIGSALCLAGTATAGAGPTDIIAYQPAGSWVVEAPAVDPTPPATGVPIQIAYLDNQIRIAADGTENAYTAYRFKILKPEALSAGNLILTWQPDDGPMTVHYVRLIRNEQIIDVLTSSKFTVLQREAQLEQSMLTGQRTANLQVPGLQVGDEIAFAFTGVRRRAAFAGRTAGLMQLPIMGTTGAFRDRLLWPHDQKISWQASADLPPLQPITKDGQEILEVTLLAPKGAIPTEGAPLRYNVRRLIEYSNFGNWGDVSRLMAPLFEHASIIDPGSPLEAEVSAIAARTTDPTERAEAALQLIEDRIRYVFVGLDGGNFTPATAEETWSRRFGDCKAKSALLVAVLRQLGLKAEAALVNSHGGDGVDQRLPGPFNFDHAVVRVIVAGKVHWLDGTRLGDRFLDNLPSPFRWALPLDANGADLERIEPRDNGFPSLIEIVDIDATAGADQDALVSVQNILRGDEAFAIRTKLAGLSPDDADRGLKSYWRQQISWATPDKVSWSYDERRMAVTLSLIGRGNPEWKGDPSKGYSLNIPGAGFNPPDVMRRPLDQNQSASWAVGFPNFRCWVTTIHLPKADSPLAWSLYADPMNQRLGGVTYWRASGFNGHIVRTVMSRQSYEPEVSPQEATILNRSISDFNNNMSNIAEESVDNVLKSSTILPFDDSIDWLNAPNPCIAVLSR